MPARDAPPWRPEDHGKEAVAVLPRFSFESGESIEHLKLGYVSYGELDGAGGNAVLLCPGTANDRHSADGYIGPGNALDPRRHFIISVDAIGAGASSQPADGLFGTFPRYTVRDLVHAQRALVAALGITRLEAVVGASMGAFQALEWCVTYPGFAEKAVLMVPAARAGAVFRGIVRSMIEIIALDPAWSGGRYAAQPLAGLRAAGRAYFPWTVTDAYLEATDPETLERERQDTIERSARWDAWNLIRRYEASSGHDVALPFGGDLEKALARVKAHLLVLPTSSDRLLGLASARDIARLARRAEYVEVPSERGHLGWRAVPGRRESQIIKQEIIRFFGRNP